MASPNESDDDTSISTDPDVVATCAHCGVFLDPRVQKCALCDQRQLIKTNDIVNALCDHVIQDDALYCRHCGAETAFYLEQKKIGNTLGWHKPDADNVKFTPCSEVECVGCEQLFTDDMKLCLNCGTLREPVQQCDECSNVFLDDSKFCRYCGLIRSSKHYFAPLSDISTFEPSHSLLFKRMNEEKKNLEAHLRYSYIENKKCLHGGLKGPCLEVTPGYDLE